MKAVVSFSSVSPSMMVMDLRDKRSARASEMPITASGGARIAPSTNAGAQPRWKKWCAAAATANAVAITSPTARSVTLRRLARSPRSEVVIADRKSSGGTKMVKARAGSISTTCTPGIKAATRPPNTSMMGTGIETRLPSTARPVEAQMRTRMVSKPLRGRSPHRQRALRRATQ